MNEQRVIGELLSRQGLLSAEQLESLVSEGGEKQTQLTELLIQQKLASEKQITQALAAECGIEFIEDIDVEVG